MSGMEFHPLALLFPLLDELVADICAHGLREPIVVFEGKILDGRNRFLACQRAGVEPSFKEYVGNDPLAYVISLNLKRRHLDTSQRAMIAAKIANMRQGARTDLQPSANLPELSQSQAAEMLNVGEHCQRRQKGS
jgi:ParB-like nuclease family protein